MKRKREVSTFKRPLIMCSDGKAKSSLIDCFRSPSEGAEDIKA